MGTGRKWYVVGLIPLLVILAGLIEYRARNELAQAREARAGHQVAEAIKHYSRGLIWYLPSGAAETAAEELLDLGLTLEKQGHDQEAARALSLMRAGLYGARGLYLPRRDLIERAEPVLARLRAKAKLGPKASEDDIQRQAGVYLDLMRRPARPGVGPGLAATGGFILWATAVLAFIAVYFGKGGGIKKAWPWTALAAIGIFFWIWGMMAA